MKARLGSTGRIDTSSSHSRGKPHTQAQGRGGEGRGGEGRGGTHPSCLGRASSARVCRKGERDSHCGWTAAPLGKPYELVAAERGKEGERGEQRRRECHSILFPPPVLCPDLFATQRLSIVLCPDLFTTQRLQSWLPYSRSVEHGYEDVAALYLAVLHDPGLVQTGPDALEPARVLRVGTTTAAAVLQHHGVVDQPRSTLVCEGGKRDDVIMTYRNLPKLRPPSKISPPPSLAKSYCKGSLLFKSTPTLQTRLATIFR